MSHTTLQYANILHLFDDVEGKLQPLSLQHRYEVLEEDGEMFTAVSKWNQDCHLQHKYWSKNQLIFTKMVNGLY